MNAECLFYLFLSVIAAILGSFFNCLGVSIIFLSFDKIGGYAIGYFGGGLVILILSFIIFFGFAKLFQLFLDNKY